MRASTSFAHLSRRVSVPMLLVFVATLTFAQITPSDDAYVGATGPQGPQGPTGPTGTNLGAMNAALLRWYSQTYTVGTSPSAVAFDGTNIWVANTGSGNVTELSASTGAVVGTYFIGSAPYGVAFDGTNIWVTSYFNSNVTKLLASSGAVVGTYTVGTNPFGVAFDGSNIWVTNDGSNTVTKIPVN